MRITSLSTGKQGRLLVYLASVSFKKVAGAKEGSKPFPWLSWRRLVSPGSLLHAVSNRKVDAEGLGGQLIYFADSPIRSVALSQTLASRLKARAAELRGLEGVLVSLPCKTCGERPVISLPFQVTLIPLCSGSCWTHCSVEWGRGLGAEGGPLGTPSRCPRALPRPQLLWGY